MIELRRLCMCGSSKVKFYGQMYLSKTLTVCFPTPQICYQIFCNLTKQNLSFFKHVLIIHNFRLVYFHLVTTFIALYRLLAIKGSAMHEINHSVMNKMNNSVFIWRWMFQCLCIHFFCSTYTLRKKYIFCFFLRNLN